MLLGSAVLEVAFGLIFVYLLLSLLCSAIGEYIEAKFNNRAKYLQQGIQLLLNETRGGGVDLAKMLYSHGLVRPLYRDAGKLPSYIPSRTFALALWNMATTAAATGDQATTGAVGVTAELKQIRAAVAAHVPNSELRTALLTLIDEADGDIVRARKNVEEWYEAMMDRVSGWYKRRTTVIMLVLGFVVAGAINADTISLVRTLARDGALRGSIAAAAERYLTPPPATMPPATTPSTTTPSTTTPPTTAPPTTTPPATEQPATAGAGSAAPAEETADERDKAATTALKSAYAAVDELGLPLGWVNAPKDPTDPRKVPNGWYEWVLKLFGILLTGFAISQGAPFWFDLLNKFMVIRSTVKPTEKSQEQPSKDKPAPGTSSAANKEPEKDTGGSPAKG